MSDRVKGLTVTVRPDLRDDDAEYIISAISMIKGVVSVEAHIADPAHHMAMMTIKRELQNKLRDVLKD